MAVHTWLPAASCQHGCPARGHGVLASFQGCMEAKASLLHALRRITMSSSRIPTSMLVRAPPGTASRPKQTKL
eukprot:scaffold18777_cov123-Isochrysis_galbana.AAC.5